MKSRITEYVLDDECELKVVFAENMAHNFSRHSHESYVICVILKGTRVLFSGGGSSVYSAGEVYIIKPFQEHSCFSVSENGVDYIAVSINPEQLEMIKANIDVIVNKIASEVLSEIGYKESEFGIITNISNSIRRIIDESRSVIDDEVKAVTKSMDFINENFYLKITLGDIADSVFMSKYNFQRQFVRHVGMSPAAYLDKRRVAEVFVKLNAGARAAEIALACGFADQSHMCRVIKKVTGVTVKNYIKLKNSD